MRQEYGYTQTLSNLPLSVEDTDSALLNLIHTTQDKIAYKALVNRYLQPLWRLASNILNDKSEAEDIIQDVFAQLWHTTPDWDDKGEASFKTWLYRVTLNKCIDVKRKKSRQALNADTALAFIKDSRASSEEMLHQKQNAKRLRAIVKRLPKTQQQALHLFYFQEKSIEDIAVEMDASIDSIKSLLKRGRQNARDAYERNL
jgi:RNA polymerase sigma-70 factor (ECF subfamily)